MDIAAEAGAGRLEIGGRVVHDGKVRFGSIHITGPGLDARSVWHEPFTSFHLFMPREALLDGTFGSSLCATVPTELAVRDDPALARAILVWLDLQQGATEELDLYGAWIASTIVTRIARTHLASHENARAEVSPLPPWRVRQALDYIEEHLGGTIRLEEVARAARLSPMHFAAQFRRTTGLSPYRYVIRRRIERAQELMMCSGLSLAEIALSSGFSSQTHFTATFRQVIGTTPHRWRRLAA